MFCGEKKHFFRMHLHGGGQCLERLPRLGFGICGSHLDKEGPRERWWGFYGGTCSVWRDHLDRLEFRHRREKFLSTSVALLTPSTARSATDPPGHVGQTHWAASPLRVTYTTSWHSGVSLHSKNYMVCWARPQESSDDEFCSLTSWVVLWQDVLPVLHRRWET